MMRYAFMLLFLATAAVSFSQENSKKLLQQQRSVLSKQLDALNKQIAKTDKNLTASAQQRAGLQKQIAGYKQQISLLDKQLGSVQNNLQQTDARLSGMYTRLIRLKRSYAASLVLSWKLMNESQVIKAVYVADDANETQQRMHYIKVLRQLQLKQVQEIRSLQQEYNARKKLLGITEEQMTSRLQQQVNASAQLSGKEKTLNAEAEQMQKRKDALLALLNRKKDMQRSIENRLSALATAIPKPVVKPVPIPVNKPASPAVAGVKEKIANKPVAPVLKSNNMSRSSKGYLPCPVNGTIIMRFGRVNIDGGIFDNSFLTFETNNAGAAVTNVYAGRVTDIQKDEDLYIVYVLHGDVYSIYGNLLSVSVQKGQEINGGTVVGKTSLNTKTGKGEMEFGIYESKKLVNPELWISCR